MRLRCHGQASALTACLACSALFVWVGCTDDRAATGEPAADPSKPSAEVSSGPGETPEQPPTEGRPTNRSLFTERIAAQAEGLTPEDEAAALIEFRRVWSKHKPAFRSKFLGVPTYQNPLDAWVVQEVIAEVAPDVFVEAGTARGGSALLWAMVLREVNPDGRVITIDIEDKRDPRAKQHPLAEKYIDFLHGSSTDPAIVAEVKRRVAGKRVLVLLDSLHTGEHIADEIAAYAPLVEKGSYVIVQDTAFGGEQAARDFVEADSRFVIDRSRERFVLTNSRSGYLRRVR